MRRMGTGLLLAGVLALGACAPRADDGLQPGGGAAQARVVDGIAYRAETRVMESHPVQLHTTATVTNTTQQAREIEFPDGCTVLIRAYRTAERSGAPAWDQQRVAVCTMAIQIVRLAPGESREFGMHAGAAEILGDSLPAGRYYLTALLRPDGDRVEVPAGEAELAPRRP